MSYILIAFHAAHFVKNKSFFETAIYKHLLAFEF